MHTQDSIVITRKTITKTVLNNNGTFYETVSDSVVVKSSSFDCPVDWDKVYDAVVTATKTEAFKNL